MMKSLLLILGVLKLSLLVKSNGVNEGASTSTETLSHEERCQINEAVDETVRCMFGRNINYDGDLEEMVRTRFLELEVLYNFYYQRIGLVLYGTDLNGNDYMRPNWESRVRYYSMRIRMKMTEITKEACASHYYRNDRYFVETDTKSIIFEDIIPVDRSSRTCLCETGKNERLCDRKLNRNRKQHDTTSILRIRKNRPRKFLKVVPPSGDNVSQHHVIPLDWIAKFFKAWLPNQKSKQNQNVRRNFCTQTLMLRMNLFMKQMMIVPFAHENRVVGENVTMNVDWRRFLDDDYFENTMRSQTYWSFGGNVFEGPSNRGAFDPRMLYPEDGFEYDSEPIIGTRH